LGVRDAVHHRGRENDPRCSAELKLAPYHHPVFPLCFFSLVADLNELFARVIYKVSKSSKQLSVSATFLGSADARCFLASD
jgi:hypothetical protein